MNYSAIILSGGKSSRMGKDKGLITYQGKCLIEYSLAAAQEFTSNIFIITSNEEYNQFGFARFEDETTDIGPLGGIQKGLRVSESKWNIILSADIPLINSEVIKKLILVSGNEKVKVATCMRKTQPLIGIYSKEILPKLDEFIENGGRSVMQLLKLLPTKYVEFDLEFENSFINVNTRKEFENLSK